MYRPLLRAADLQPNGVGISPVYVMYVLTIAIANLALGYGAGIWLRRPDDPAGDGLLEAPTISPPPRATIITPVIPSSNEALAPTNAEDESTAKASSPPAGVLLTNDRQTSMIERTAFEALVARWQNEDTTTARHAALGLLEVDQMAEIGEQHGTDVAERIKSELSGLIDELMRKPRGCDMAADYDGRRICFFFGDTTAHDATHALERMRLAIAQARFVLGREVLHLTASCGALAMHAGEEVDLLFARLELAVRQASILGGNRTTLDEGLGPAPIEPLSFELAECTINIDP